MNDANAVAARTRILLYLMYIYNLLHIVYVFFIYIDYFSVDPFIHPGVSVEGLKIPTSVAAYASCTYRPMDETFTQNLPFVLL